MNRGFYFKMAVGNIRKNKNIYRSYLLAVSLVTGMFYILSSIQAMVMESDMIGRTKMTLILNVCIFCTALFALIILFYVNYFVMKQRKKEWSLYSILGMEKRHLARLAVTEVLLVFGDLWGHFIFSADVFDLFKYDSDASNAAIFHAFGFRDSDGGLFRRWIFSGHDL